MKCRCSIATNVNVAALQQGKSVFLAVVASNLIVCSFFIDTCRHVLNAGIPKNKSQVSIMCMYVCMYKDNF